MKQLLLIRHAKSSWDDLGASDFERKLNHRGLRDVPLMGARLKSRAILPDEMLVSSAMRTRETARLLADEIGFDLNKASYSKTLYLASPATMLQLIRSCDDQIDTLAVIAHNPGVTELTNRLARTYISNIPTCGIATIQLPIHHWCEAGGGELIDFDYPKRELNSGL